jgi:hypothetical protein
MILIKGEYTIAGLIDFFDSLNPPPSNAQLNLQKNSAQIKVFIFIYIFWISIILERRT